MSLAESVAHFADSSIGILRSRLELVSMDLEDELRSAITILLTGLAATVLALFAVLFGVFCVVALFWDDHRIAALLGASAAFALVSIFLAVLIHRHLANKPAFLAATLQELDRDRQSLRTGR